MVVSGSLLTAGPSPNQFARSTTTWWSLACRSAPPSLLAPLRYSASFLLKPIFKDRSGTPWPTSTSMWPGSASRHSSSSSGLWHSHTGDGDKSRLVGVPKSSATSDLPPSILPAPKRKRHYTLPLHQLPTTVWQSGPKKKGDISRRGVNRRRCTTETGHGTSGHRFASSCAISSLPAANCDELYPSSILRTCSLTASRSPITEPPTVSYTFEMISPPPNSDCSASATPLQRASSCSKSPSTRSNRSLISILSQSAFSSTK